MENQDKPETTPLDAEAIEALQALAEEARELTKEIASIEQTAPDLPYEITLKNSATYYQRLAGGRMMLKFVPVALTPTGPVLAPPGIEIIFSAEGWLRFQEETAADGEKKPVIETASVVPPPKMAIPRSR